MCINQKIVVLFLAGVFFSSQWCSADDGAEPVAQWTFDRKNVRSSRVRPVEGKLSGRVYGKVSFSKDKPQSLELSGDKSRILISDRLGGKTLPGEVISLEAWVRVRETREWGGVVSAIQDNGIALPGNPVPPDSLVDVLTAAVGGVELADEIPGWPEPDSAPAASPGGDST